MEKNHQLHHELQMLLGPIPKTLEEQLQVELKESWANYHFGNPHSIEEQIKKLSNIILFKNLFVFFTINRIEIVNMKINILSNSRFRLLLKLKKI